MPHLCPARLAPSHDHRFAGRRRRRMVQQSTPRCVISVGPGSHQLVSLTKNAGSCREDGNTGKKQPIIGEFAVGTVATMKIHDQQVGVSPNYDRPRDYHDPKFDKNFNQVNSCRSSSSPLHETMLAALSKGQGCPSLALLA